MGVEVPESNLAVFVETGNEEKISVENQKMNIKFGSDGVDEPAKDDGKKVSDANLPNNVADEWPEPSQIHSFYIVKYRPFEDQNLRAKLDLAEKELQKKNQARFQITEKLREKRAVRAQVISEIRSLSVENKQFRTIMDEKRKEMEPLHQALGKLRGAPNGGRERGSVICSSEEELNDLVKSLQCRIQHESIPLSEEKQIMREIKQLEGTRDKVIANAAEKARIQDALGEKEVIQDQVKLIGVDLDGVRKEKQVVNSKLKQLDEEKASVDKEINDLQEELTAMTEKRDKTFETIQEMRKQREHANAQYYQNRTLLIKAKELAARKDVEALKELSHTEVEQFISLCSSNKAFRDDYKRRVLLSLDMRQLSSDGRMRNLDEKPFVAVEAPTPSETQRIVKPNVKQPAEDSIPPAQLDTSSVQKAQKEKNARNQKEANKKTESILDKIVLEDKDVPAGTDKLQKYDPPKVDEMKLKEMKREEEIAKAKQAMERKKKLAEKAAAKAAIKAQKEAEKKLKEREKRERKKAGVVISQDSEEPTEAVAEVAELEKTEEKAETPGAPKNKAWKENTTRHRARPRGPDSLPKVILKRKKATNYCLWAVPAILVVLVLLAFSYSYLSQDSRVEW